MGIKLGDISPLAGVVTGEGMYGDLAQKGFGGLLPMAISKDADKDREEKEKRKAAAGMPPAAPGPSGMKKGGKVMSSASKRADGIAQRGKTRGKMV
jgi:hypothetical protein